MGRKEILDWVNDTLDLNVPKIEATCTGAIACQLVDAHFPGKIPMSKVNWEARNDYEYFGNYKVLQGAFDRLKIDRAVEVEKLSRGKYQDNLEFMQWMKGFCERHSVAEGYDAVERRAKGKGAARVAEMFGGPSSRAPRAPTKASGGRGAASSAAAPAASSRSRGGPAAASGKASLPPPPGEKENRNAQPLGRRPSQHDASGDASLQRKVKDAEDRNDQLMETIQNLEKERDFYYDKLREIEV